MKRYLSLLTVPVLLSAVLYGADQPKPVAPAEPSAAAPENRFAPLFRPYQTDRATLSPDGKYLAYSIREGEILSVVVVEIDKPTTATAKVTVASDATATPLLTNSREKSPATIRWMRWVTATRIVVETNQSFPNKSGDDWNSTTGAVFAFDFDGKNSKMIVSPNEVQEFKSNANFGPKSSFSDQKIPTPDQAPAAATTSQINDPFATDATNDNETVETPALSPRSLRVFDFAPDDHNAILVRTAGVQKYDVYKIDINTSKQHETVNESVDPDTAPLLDRQGKARVVIPTTTRVSFPHHYELAKQSGLSRWTNLDKVAGFAGPGFTLSPDNFLGERAIPMGFDEDPNILYYASNIGRNTFGIYSLKVKTGKQAEFKIENPIFDLVQASLQEYPNPNDLVYDRFTRKLMGIRYEGRIHSTIWLNPELGGAQKELETVFKNRSVDILEWDTSFKHLLVLARSPADAGAFFIFNRETAKLSEFARRAPWLDQNQGLLSTDFAFPNPKGGGVISGTLTLPRNVRVQIIPVIVLCPNDPWLRTRSEYNAEIHALADMGAAIVQVNGRGTWGFGREQREAAKGGFDKVQVEDIGAAIDSLTQQFKFMSPKLVAIVGEERGGFLALRALQLDPNRYRCAISINPTVDLAEWIGSARWGGGSSGPALIKSFFSNTDQLNERPLQKHPETITKPICVFSYPGPEGETSSLAYREARDLASSVKSKEVPVEFYSLNDDYARALPAARSRLFSHVEDFLNAYVYAYKVDVKDATPVKEK